MVNLRHQFLVTMLVMQLINVSLEFVRAVQNGGIDLDISAHLQIDCRIVEIIPSMQ